MKRQITINFSDKFLYAFIVVMVLIVSAIGVYAYGGSSPSVMGHSSGELDGVATTDYVDGKLQYTNYVFEYGSPRGNWKRLNSFHDFCALTGEYKADCEVKYIGGWWQIYMLGTKGAHCNAVCVDW